MRCLLVLILVSCAASAQSPGPHRLAVSGGWATETGERGRSAPAIGFSYGYRAVRFMEIEAGFDTALHPSGTICNARDCYDPKDRYSWLPFGVRFVTPVAGRYELSAGGGGLYQRYTVGGGKNSFECRSHNAWGGYFKASAAFAADPHRHVWLDFAPRLMLANSYPRDRWLLLTGEISFRF